MFIFTFARHAFVVVFCRRQINNVNRIDPQEVQEENGFDNQGNDWNEYEWDDDVNSYVNTDPAEPAINAHDLVVEDPDQIFPDREYEDAYEPINVHVCMDPDETIPLSVVGGSTNLSAMGQVASTDKSTAETCLNFSNPTSEMHPAPQANEVATEENVLLTQRRVVQNQQGHNLEDAKEQEDGQVPTTEYFPVRASDGASSETSVVTYSGTNPDPLEVVEKGVAGMNEYNPVQATEATTEHTSVIFHSEGNQAEEI